MVESLNEWLQPNDVINAVNTNNVSIVLEYLKQDGDPNLKEKEMETPLIMLAASKGFTTMVRILMNAGADINAKNAVGWPVLIEASAHGHTEIVQMLLQSGADVNESDFASGMTALMTASRFGGIETVQTLLQAGSKITLGRQH